MNITITREGTQVTAAIEGRLDTVTSPQAEAELRPAVEGATKLILNLSGTEYISSAGLRVILSLQKTMNVQGSMVLRDVPEDILDILDVTGLTDLLTIE